MPGRVGGGHHQGVTGEGDEGGGDAAEGGQNLDFEDPVPARELADRDGRAVADVVMPPDESGSCYDAGLQEYHRAGPHQGRGDEDLVVGVHEPQGRGTEGGHPFTADGPLTAEGDDREAQVGHLDGEQRETLARERGQLVPVGGVEREERVRVSGGIGGPGRHARAFR
jgi:hypothetical protein